MKFLVENLGQAAQGFFRTLVPSEKNLDLIKNQRFMAWVTFIAQLQMYMFMIFKKVSNQNQLNIY